MSSMSATKNKSKKTTKSRSKSVVKQPKISLKTAKVRKKPQYRSFYFHKRVKHSGPPLPSWFTLTKKAFQLLWENRRPLKWFFIVYGLLFLVFVQGVVAPLDISSLRENIKEYGGGAVTISDNVSILGLLLNTSLGASGDVAGMYQMIFIVTGFLALIWLFRQQQAGQQVGMKDAYYRGMYPLVPFVLIILVIAVQAIPAAIGNMLYGAVVSGGLAVTFIEQTVWFSLFSTLIVLTFYLASTSIIGLFIVTLPDMTPRIALREAKKLVAGRRFSLSLKIIALFLVMGAIYIAIVLPAIFIAAGLAQVLFFVLIIAAVPFAVAYLFVLYRELL